MRLTGAARAAYEAAHLALLTTRVTCSERESLTDGLIFWFQEFIEPGVDLLPHVDGIGPADDMPAGPVAQEARAFPLAIHRHKEFFALLDGHKIHVALNDQHRRLDAVGVENRTVADVTLDVLPRRCTQCCLATFSRYF